MGIFRLLTDESFLSSKDTWLGWMQIGKEPKRQRRREIGSPPLLSIFHLYEDMPLRLRDIRRHTCKHRRGYIQF